MVQPEAWNALGLTAAAAFGAAGAGVPAWLASRSARSEASAAKDQAAQAVANTTKLSNGFADKTTSGIDEVKGMLSDQREQTEQLIQISGRTVARLDQVITRQDKADARFTDYVLGHGSEHVRLAERIAEARNPRPVEGS